MAREGIEYGFWSAGITRQRVQRSAKELDVRDALLQHAPDMRFLKKQISCTSRRESLARAAGPSTNPGPER